MFLCSGREEEESLRDKIRADHERALQEAKEKLRKSREELQAEIQTEKNKVVEDLKRKEAGPKPLPPVPMPKVVGVGDGEPPEPDVKEKRDKIREVRWRGRLSWKWSSSWVGFAVLQRLSTQSCKGLNPARFPPTETDAGRVFGVSSTSFSPARSGQAVACAHLLLWRRSGKVFTRAQLVPHLLQPFPDEVEGCFWNSRAAAGLSSI